MQYCLCDWDNEWEVAEEEWGEGWDLTTLGIANSSKAGVPVPEPNITRLGLGLGFGLALGLGLGLALGLVLGLGLGLGLRLSLSLRLRLRLGLGFLDLVWLRMWVMVCTMYQLFLGR